MTGSEAQTPSHPAPTPAPEASNDVRLTGRQWVLAAVLVVPVLALLPGLWERVEPFHPGPDYRVPYKLSEDYWLYARYARLAASGDRVLVVGDSVVWGEYVTPDRTLSHYLNAKAGNDRFANLGLNGTYPVAMAGLIEHHGGGIRNARVLLHCNLLWTSSPRHDLQTGREFRFNHPRLTPQFVGSVPCYRATLSQRVGVVAERLLPLRQWTRHVRAACFDNADLPAWTVAHPYANPLAPLARAQQAPDPAPRQDARSWRQRGLDRRDFDWVELSASLQWRSFRRAVEVLQQRGNRVFVLVGPFNEHMLTDAGAAVYARRVAQVRAWLGEQGLAHHVAAALPSDQCADASHPLAEGYAELADRLSDDESFARFCSAPPSRAGEEATP